MSNKYTKRKTVFAEINVVPFLDVLLVLLLIFIATAPIISQSVSVDLPESSTTETVTKEEAPQVILEVAGANMYTLSINGDRVDNLTDQQVIENASKEFIQNNTSLFFVGGAKDVPYQEVIKAIDLLHSAGIKKVGLMTMAK